ncbi:MAG: hypothetical protein J5616_00910 [Bacteroidaceae bacterium]|nr:hypothetical protein [Bacteroidaceae bacterium]
MTEKEKKTLSDLFEAMGKTGAQFQIGQVIGSQTNTYNYYGERMEKEEGDIYPALPLLKEMVLDAVQEGKTAKYILLPLRAAMEADALLPSFDVNSFNKSFGTSLNKANFSNWVNGTNGSSYDEKEIAPFIKRFRDLK